MYIYVDSITLLSVIIIIAVILSQYRGNGTISIEINIASKNVTEKAHPDAKEKANNNK